jgi:rhodanese-related sulfurtransferase
VLKSQPSAGCNANDRVSARRSLLLEGLFVAALGILLAFLANSVSPRGLALNRNYFPTDISTSHPDTATTSSAAQTGSTNPPSALEVLANQLHQEGIGLVDSIQVKTLFKDPRLRQGAIIFIDARDDEHYQGGHIPEAYQLDYYRPATYLATVLPLCQTAEQIVVYCNGGDCEDSKHTAIFLRDAGIPASKLLVYAGGIMEWTTNGLPVETGQRGSGTAVQMK